MVKRLAYIALVAATACTFPEDPLPPGERQIIVHAILDPSRRYQWVALSRTDASVTKPADLEGASVVLTTPDGAELVAKREIPTNSTGQNIGQASSYRIDLLTAGVSLVPGGTYQLRVITVVGDTITGTTTIPTATQASAPPRANFDRLRDTLSLSWARVPGARTFELQVWSTFTFSDGKGGTETYAYLEHVAYADTSIRLAGTATTAEDDQIFQRNSGSSIYVYAVDDNYYEYYRRLGDPFIGAAPSRLKGGLGVFGAVVPVVRRELDVK
jgi:hypothetical protein